MAHPYPLLAQTPLHAWHAVHGARFAERDGWLVPTAYPGNEPSLPAGPDLALVDLSAFVKIAFLGRGVPDLTRTLLGDGPANRSRDVSPFSVAGPALACRLTADHLLLLTTTTDAAAVARHLAPLSQTPGIVQVEVTTAYADFGLLGAAWEEMLSRLTALDTRATPAGSCAETGFAGVPALLVPSAEFGRPGVRICVGWDVAEYVWERLLEAGRPWNIAPRAAAELRAP
jgi:sarcosine oxidase subunit alpha